MVTIATFAVYVGRSNSERARQPGMTNLDRQPRFDLHVYLFAFTVSAVSF